MKKPLLIFYLMLFTISAFAMEISSYNKANSLNEENLFDSAIESTNAENPYSFMQEITQGISESKKIKRLHHVLSKNGLNTESFLEKFFETKKINFIATEKGCSAHEAKKILDDVPSSKLTFPETEIVFDSRLPKSTRKIVTNLIENDSWFKEVPISISFVPDLDLIAGMAPQNHVTKTFDLAIGPLFYYCCSTDAQKIGCFKHELTHAKRQHSQIDKKIALSLPKSDIQPFKRLLEYEADLFAAVQDVPSAYAMEETLIGLKIFSNSNLIIDKKLIASKLPSKLRHFSGKGKIYPKSFSPCLDHPSPEMRCLNAMLVRELLILERKDSCYLM